MCALARWWEGAWAGTRGEIEARTQSVPAYGGVRWYTVAVRWRAAAVAAAYGAGPARHIARLTAAVSQRHRTRGTVRPPLQDAAALLLY